MASRSFLFGLVTVPMYEYRCVMTCAQIELLAIDKPRTEYRDRLRGGGQKGKKGGTRRDLSPLSGSVESAARAWMNKYADGSRPVISMEGINLKSK